nr:95_t:CDS:2 [Entrophospora candida]
MRFFDRMDYYSMDDYTSNITIRGGKNSKDIKETLYNIIRTGQSKETLRIGEKHLNMKDTYGNYKNDEAYVAKSNAIYSQHPYDMANEVDKLFVLLRDIYNNNAFS